MSNTSPEKSIIWILYKFRNIHWVDRCGVVPNLCGDDYRVVVLGFMVGKTIVQSFHTHLNEDLTITKLPLEVEEIDLQNGENVYPRFVIV